MGGETVTDIVDHVSLKVTDLQGEQVSDSGQRANIIGRSNPLSVRSS